MSEMKSIGEVLDEMKSAGGLLGELGMGAKPGEPRKRGHCPFCDGPCQLPQTTQEQAEQFLKDEVALSWEHEKPKMPAYMAKRNVPEKLLQDLKGVLETSDALLGVELWEKKPESLVLVLCGMPRVGKSLACAWFLSKRTVTYRTQFGGPQTEYMKSMGWEAEPTLTWTKWDTGFQWLRASTLGLMDRFDRDVQQRLRELEAVPVLVIDEVGGSGVGDAEQAKRVDLMVGKRIDASVRTLLTTNYGAEELRANLGDRVMERIRRHGTVVECKDFRAEQKLL